MVTSTSGSSQTPPQSSPNPDSGEASSSSSAFTSSKDGIGSRLGRATRAAAHIGSVVDDWPLYSSQPEDYIIGDTIGFGASSVVYEASFLPLQGRACAVKIIDLEAFGRDTEELRRETQLMSLSKHPNVLRVRGCWVSGSKLHIATRLMSAGSMLDIMRFSHPDGFEETVIATILRQALEGLNYLHINGWLHRDLKAANMLVDDDGTVLLGDFGVGVYLGDGEGEAAAAAAAGGSQANSNEDKGTWAEGKRKSFVGTPCWMAPEVVERKHYGTKADIWSFGITALELTQGHAPYSRLAPVKVLMKTLQEEPPTLDRTGNAHKYSKVFDDFVRQCLQKDPAKRPPAEKLLQHAFFKQAKPKKHLITAILAGLPPLVERQERRRAMSIASLRNQASWDFGSVSSRGAGGGITPSGERYDPFLHFSGTVAPISPSGSVRSRIVSIDGSHAFVETEDQSLEHLAERWKSRGLDEVGFSPRNSLRFGGKSSTGRRARNLSTDSNPGSLGRAASAGPRHRKSVSFDEPNAPGISQPSSSEPSSDPPSSAAADSSLAPIAEMRSPQMAAEAVLAPDIPSLLLPDASSPPLSSSPPLVLMPVPASKKVSKASRSPSASPELASKPLVAEPSPPISVATASPAGSTAETTKPGGGLLSRTLSRTMGGGGNESSSKSGRLGKFLRREAKT